MGRKGKRTEYAEWISTMKKLDNELKREKENKPTKENKKK